MIRRLVPCLLGLWLLSGCDAGSSSGGDPVVGSTGTTVKGCAIDSLPPLAPGGYYTNGATVCTADGVAHLFHGVDRPSLEWDPNGESNNSSGIPAQDFQAMAAWHANVVRIALNQDFWLSGATLYDPGYSATVDRAVRAAEAAGLDVILDLHWSDRGDLSVSMPGGGQGKTGHADQQQMADVNSKQFWTEVATKYQADGHVLFELYNEPHDVGWNIWLKGGVANGYQAVGMQQLYDTVRATGANNVVIAGGLSWAFDLGGVGASPIQGYNIMYATHPYKPQDPVTRWQSSFGYLASQNIAPVIATEFADESMGCTSDWDTQLIKFADDNQISWTAWAWWAAGCAFPGLISDWQYTPTAQGAVVKAALLAYPYTPPVGISSTGAGGEGGALGTGTAGVADTTGAGGVSGAAGT